MRIAPLALAASLAFAGFAQAQPTPLSNAPASFAPLARQLLPAVVNISTSQSVQPRAGRPDAPETPQAPPGSPFEDFFRDFFNRNRPPGAPGAPGPETQRPRRAQSLGSGFIIDASGLVVTNNHVIDGADEINVILQDNTSIRAELVGTDPRTDVAVLRIRTNHPLVAVPWGSSSAMRVGQWVIAAGNPFALGGSITAGIVSARGRDIHAGPFDDFIQTDAPINPGNSGGPLFNIGGEVIGINTAIYSPSGASAGIGFAVPSDLARPVIEAMIRGGRVERGWLGVSVQDASDAARGASGAIIMGVERNSPAARAGLRQGDVVTLLNGEQLSTSRALVRGVALLPPGQTVRLTLIRDGRQQEIPVQIGRRPQSSG